MKMEDEKRDERRRSRGHCGTRRPHAQFFSSLKHVEKRLKHENRPSPFSTLPQSPPSSPSPSPQNQENINNTEQLDSLGSPICLDYDHATASAMSNASGIPREFLSNSPDFPSSHHSPSQEFLEDPFNQTKETSVDDDIVMLMQLLGLSCFEEPKKSGRLFDVGHDEEFYRNIVGTKGPKSRKEVERLEGWIDHFLTSEKKEPLRLAHLLLGKAIVLHSENKNDDFGGFEFPSTIDEFLHNDLPKD